METSNEPLKLARALLDAQVEFTPVLKDASNPAFKRDGKESKYATLDSVISAVRPALAKHKLLVIQNAFRPAPNSETEPESKNVGVRTTLLHVESGEKLVNELVAPGGNANRFDIQTIGATITYLRRYEYLTILGLAPEDDDGNTASGRSQSEQSRPNPTPPSPNRAPTTPTAASAAPPAKDNPAPTTEGPVKAVLPEYTSSADTNEYVAGKDVYEGYIQKSLALAGELKDAGVKGTESVVKSKLGKYIRKVTEHENLKQVSGEKWETLFTAFETLMKTEEGKKKAVAVVEAANVKEGK